MKYRIVLAITSVLAAMTAILVPAFSQDGPEVLDHPFPYDIDRTEAPLVTMGEFLRDFGLSGGVVLMSDCGDEGSLRLKTKEGSTFRQVLDDFQADNPDYRWDLRANVLNLVPAAGIPPLLAAKIQTFDLQTTAQQTTAGLVFQRLRELPEIVQAAAALDLKEGTYLGGLGGVKPSATPIYVQLKDVSLQDAFNAVAQAYGHTMWWYDQRACQGEVTYTVEESQAY